MLKETINTSMDEVEEKELFETNPQNYSINMFTGVISYLAGWFHAYNYSMVKLDGSSLINCDFGFLVTKNLYADLPWGKQLYGRITLTKGYDSFNPIRSINVKIMNYDANKKPMKIFWDKTFDINSIDQVANITNELDIVLGITNKS